MTEAVLTEAVLTEAVLTAAIFIAGFDVKLFLSFACPKWSKIFDHLGQAKLKKILNKASTTRHQKDDVKKASVKTKP